MASSNNFSEYYKTISDTELLNILDNPGDYQPLAVEAAEKEFAGRQLSDTAINEARQPLVTRQTQREKEKEKAKAVETKIKAAGHTFIDTINPIQTGIPSTEKTIRLIVIVFAGIFLFSLFKNFELYRAYFSDISRFPLESILFLLPQLLFAVAVFTFWKRKSIGWTLMTVFLTFSIVVALWSLLQSFTWKPSGHPGLDNLFPRPSPIPSIIQLIFLIAALYVLCKQNIREVFAIDKKRIAMTIVITTLVSFFLLIISY
jgi:hypothetical protein